MDTPCACECVADSSSPESPAFGVNLRFRRGLSFRLPCAPVFPAPVLYLRLASASLDGALPFCWCRSQRSVFCLAATRAGAADDGWLVLPLVLWRWLELRSDMTALASAAVSQLWHPAGAWRAGPTFNLCPRVAFPSARFFHPQRAGPFSWSSLSSSPVCSARPLRLPELCHLMALLRVLACRDCVQWRFET